MSWTEGYPCLSKLICMEIISNLPDNMCLIIENVMITEVSFMLDFNVLLFSNLCG